MTTQPAAQEKRPTPRVEEVLRGTEQVVSYEGVTYVATEAAYYVLDYGPRPVPSSEAEEALEHGCWAGYALSRQIIQQIRAHREAYEAMRYLRAGGSSEIMRRLAAQADGEVSNINRQLNDLNALVIDRAMELERS